MQVRIADAAVEQEGGTPLIRRIGIERARAGGNGRFRRYAL
ncbi:hypothetical protein [Dongia sedimenti]|uniref:Uncharacterized protein n=1 Tax=Dongia sedimenti TaxID=3064282 RepID=A0ABU0YLG2_9PROT|nr:hypothetical protein [Rhodospirillaceae bacterium R-7]